MPTTPAEAPMPTDAFDIAVIGAGPAGLAAGIPTDLDLAPFRADRFDVVSA